MATSSNFSTDNSFIKYRIVVTENSFDRDTNTSEINVKVQAWRTNSGYTTSGTGTCYCTIDGTKYTQSISSSQTITYNSYTTLLNKTVTIEHEQDGSKTVNVSAYIKHQRFNSNSQGFNVALTTIPRQASITSIAPFTDVQNPVINYVNPLGEDVDSLILYATATDNHPLIDGRTLNKTGVAYTLELTDAEKESIYNYFPDDSVITLRFGIATTISGTVYTSTYDATLTITESAPVIGEIEYHDTNPTTVAVTEDDTVLVQNHSLPIIVFDSLTALKGANLDQITINIGGNIYPFEVTGTSRLSFGCDIGEVLNFSSNTKAICTLTDSRGYSSTKEVELTIYPYENPTMTFSVRRHNNYYSETDIYVDVKISSLGGKNRSWAYYCVGEWGGSVGPWTEISNKTVTTVTLDNTKQFGVVFLTYDSLGIYSQQYHYFLDSGVPIAFFDRKLKSTGFNCFPTDEKSVEIGGVLKFNDVSQRLYDAENLYLNIKGERIKFITGQFHEEHEYTIEYDGTYDGYIEQSHIKNSGSTQLYSGTFNSGSTTFNYGDYNYYIIKLRVSTNGNYTTMTIPKIDITTSDTTYQFSTDSLYFSFRLKYSGNTCTMTYQNRTSGSTAYIATVYGCN